MELSRRDLMKYGILGSAALLLPIERVARTQLLLNDRMPDKGLPAPYTMPWQVPPVAKPVFTDDRMDYYTMRMRAQDVRILGNGRPATTIWGYDGVTPGPTIKVRRGRRVAVRHGQELPDTHPDQLYPATTSVHLHGSASLPQYDGYASDITPPGQYKDYYYPNFQDARTLWYHDHGIHHTANNAYMGLAAQYHIIDDAVDQGLNLPTGEYDLPMVVRDAMFAANGQLIYSDNSESGVYGDVILVNGVPWPNMPVERRKYRFRILNASISRGYGFRLSNGEPFTVIATDGGIMKNPQQVKSFRHGMAERYEVIIDFTKYKAGTKIQLLNDSPKNNIDYKNTDKVMQFTVMDDQDQTGAPGNPATMYKEAVDKNGKPLYNDEVWNLRQQDVTVKREYIFERKNGHWTVNGETWENVIESNYGHTMGNPKVEATEQWTLWNKGGGWFHPVHIHLIDFKVIGRTNGNVKGVMPYELGPKDVVYVGEGEKVDVLIKFDDTRARQRDAVEFNRPQLKPRTGRYMMHCHNLVHEDHDMMIQWEVGDAGKTEVPWAPHADDYTKIGDKDPLPLTRAELKAIADDPLKGDAECKRILGYPAAKPDSEI
jgi:spore coat protein A